MRTGRVPFKEEDMSKPICLRFLLAGLVIISTSVSATGQDTPTGPVQERIRRNIQTLRLLQMTQALDLSEEQTARIFPVLNRLEKEKADLRRQVAEAVRELRTIIRGGKAKEESLSAAVDKVKSLRRAILQGDAELESFLEGQLTPVQRAKYVVFSLDFYQGLGERLRKARGPGR